MTARKLLGNRTLWSALATIAFLALLWGQAYHHSISDFDTSAVLLSMKSSLLSPSLFWWQITRYFLTVIALYFLFFYLLAELVSIDQFGLRRIIKTPVYWAAGLVFLQVIDSGWFPYSAHTFKLAFGKVIPVVCALVLGIMLLLGAAHLYWRGYKHWGKRLNISMLAVIVILAGWNGWRWVVSGPQKALPANKPNVIMIGVDGLRPDYLAYMHTWDKNYQSPMPFLDSELAKSVVFTQAYVNVARTYPSWMGMLTGQEPLQNGIRYNLQDDHGQWRNKTVTLPQYFNKAGYQTAWGIDDVGFANIGRQQGFQTVLSPEQGAIDFIIPEVISDIAIVNILSNWWPGRYLLPSAYSNRRRGYAYYPATFSRWLADYVEHTNRNKPLFMAVHFELAHYPSIWANGDKFTTMLTQLANTDKVTPPDATLAINRYNNHRIDQQIHHLMDALKRDGRLKNAIVVFLSDHGNGLKTGKTGKNRFGQTVYLGDTSYGHGTDIANLTQNHALLAIQGRGHYQIKSGYRDTLVSLPSIAPTLLQLVNIKPTQKMIAPLPLEHKPTHRKQKVVYFESGLSLPGLKSGEVNLAGNLAKKAKIYRILSDGKLVIQNSELPRLLTKKQRGAYNGTWSIINSWDKNKKTATIRFINRKTGEDKTGQPIPSQAADLLQKFCHHYTKHDRYFILPKMCSGKLGQ